jgi:protein-disulfide reductase (glutathione)
MRLRPLCTPTLALLFLSASVVGATVGCKTAPSSQTATPAPVTASSAAAPAPEASAPGREAAPAETPPEHWLTWEEGSAMARERGLPMMVFVHADWCSQCRRLEPVFDREDVRAAAHGLVRIAYNSDENAAWIRTIVGNHDTYVPRVLFLGSDGQLRPLTSSHSRYPYFYSPEMVDRLIANMQAAQVGL